MSKPMPKPTKSSKTGKLAKIASAITSKPLPKPSSRPTRLISTRSISGPVGLPSVKTTTHTSPTIIRTSFDVDVFSPPLTPTLLSPDDIPPAIPDRSFSRLSTASCSTSSTGSGRSSALSKGDLQARRRGFMRPQTTEFSNSARARDSVMALGSIAHLQYFFAKTGLLDGKGGRGLKKKASGELDLDGSSSPTGAGPGSEYLSIDYLSPPMPGSLSGRSTPEPLSPGLDRGFLSDSNLDDYPSDEDEDFMHIPPTTSTYNPKRSNLPPPPDPEVLRGHLREALAITKRAWEQAPITGEAVDPEAKSSGLELSGIDVVELATSAVRAAKAYYYTTDITRVGAKSEKALREDFIAILDALKRMSHLREDLEENDGSVTAEEKAQVVSWISSVEDCLAQEESSIGEIRRKCREWSEGDWTGREMERNHAFLSFFDPSPTPLPAPPKDETYPNEFLKELQNGLRLILIHNSIVKGSKRPFGRIPRYHTEFGKPYRTAENIRFWRKAVELRWEVKVGEWGDVFEVVNGTEQGWRGLERDINRWCETILAEARREWGEAEA